MTRKITRAPAITGRDFSLYLKKAKTIKARVVPIMLVRNTHMMHGNINKTTKNKFFFFSSVKQYRDKEKIHIEM